MSSSSSSSYIEDRVGPAVVLNAIMASSADQNRVHRDDLQSIHVRVKRLHQFADHAIRKLSGGQKEDFDAVVEFVRLKSTTAEYHEFIKNTRTVFDKCYATPGTVGAYFAGCLCQTQLGTCSPSCIGSLQLTGDNIQGAVCEYQSYIMSLNGEGVLFTPLNDVNDKRYALVFIDSHSASSFRGFSDKEKQELNKYGCHVATVIAVAGNADHLSYRNLYGGFVPVNALPSRVTIQKTPLAVAQEQVAKLKNTANLQTNFNWGVFAFIFLIVLAIFAFAAYSRRKTM